MAEDPIRALTGPTLDPAPFTPLPHLAAA